MNTTPDLSRRERKKEETRSRIFKAAVRLFRERGFEATTVDDITEKADVAKGTFFNYFPRKEAVLAYLSETRLLEAEESANALLASSRPAREKLLEMYARSASAYEEDRELSRWVLLELMKRSFSPSEETHQRWDRLLAQFIEQGQRTGEFRDDVDPVRAESLLTSVYMATLYMWVCCPQELQFPVQQEIRERLDMVLDGIGRRGG